MNYTRIIHFVAVAVAGSLTLVCFSPASFATDKNQDDISVWVPPPVGSHLGGGYVHSGRKVTKQTAAPAALSAEDAPLRQAIVTLNNQQGVEAEGFGLLAFGVSVQTKVPVDTLNAQQKASGLTYGELLVANSLAESSHNSFQQILAMKGPQTWSSLAAKLHVSQKSLIARAAAATESVKYAQARRDRRREQNIRDTRVSRPIIPQAPPGG